MISLPIGWASNIAYSLLALGIALILISIDRESRPNRALAATLFLMGMGDFWLMWLVVFDLPDPPPWIRALQSTVFQVPAAAEWLWLETGALLPAGAGSRLIKHLFRFCTIQGLLHVIAQIAFADAIYAPTTGDLDTSNWLAHRSAAAARISDWSQVWDQLSLVSLLVPVVMLLLRRRDAQESIRLTGVALALPFYGLALFLADEPLGSTTLRMLAMIVLFSATMRFHRAQGRRGEFLSRFLSPQVGELVRERGLQQALHQTQQEITVVCCDLRGFTAYAQAHSSERVTQVLTDYYNAVCGEVARFGGTVKDFAGDGILVLMGAPLAMSDHARRGLDLAHAMTDAARRSIARWADAATPLGIGAGVASGRVTVGVIEAASRMEYAAIGPAVNVALRLCARAKDGEILIDRRPAELSGSTALEDRGALELKDLGEIGHYAMTAA